MAAARAKKLRDVLDENQRATARLGAIVSRAPTGSSRSSASSWVPSRRARVTFRTRTKNLTAVHEETSRWLEQLEVSWSSGALLERGFEDDDSDALLACVDRLVEAEAFFSRGARTRAPSPPGDTPATSSTRASSDARKPSRASCSCTTEPRTRPPAREAEPEPTREKTTTPDAREASRDATRVSPSLAPPPPPGPADAGALPPPPPPLVFERPPTPSTPAMLLGRLATLRTPTGGGASSSPSSFRTPSTPSAATPRTPSLSARRAEARRASFFDVSPALRRVARILVDAPYARRDTRGNAIRAYVTTRDAASAASLEARGLEMASEGRRGAPRRVSAAAARVGW